MFRNTKINTQDAKFLLENQAVQSAALGTPAIQSGCGGCTFSSMC